MIVFRKTENLQIETLGIQKGCPKGDPKGDPKRKTILWWGNTTCLCGTYVLMNLVSNHGMLVTETCYYLGNEVFGVLLTQDMSLNATCFCSQLYIHKINLRTCFMVLWCLMNISLNYRCIQLKIVHHNVS